MTEIWCFIVCFGSSQVALPPSVDSFCATYQQVVTSKEDLEKVKLLPRATRDRLQSNELEYLCRCKEYKHALCEAKKGAS